MKILSRYLVKDFLVHVAFALCVYLFVLLVGKVFKELLTVLISRHLGIGVLAGFAAYTMPYLMSFSLPLATLTGSVLTFSKLSADNELLAAQASGISIARLALPVLAITGVLSVAALYANAELAPRGLVAARQLVRDALLDKMESDPSVLFEPGREVKDFAGYVVRVGGKNEKNGRLTDVRLTVLNSDGKIHSTYWAEEAEIKVNRAEGKVTVRFFKFSGVLHEPTIRPGFGGEDYAIDFDLKDYLGKAGYVVKWTNMTLRELHARHSKLESEGQSTSSITLEAHTRVSFAFACLAFAMVGIPLGVRTHRRETSVGILVSILAAMVYYGFVVMAQSIKERPDITPVLIMWLPNVLCYFLGGWLLWKASRK